MSVDARPSWHHPRVLLLLLTVFLCGMAAGALALRLTGVAAARPTVTNWKDASREITIAHLKSELDLTEDQAREVETVLDDYVLYYQNLQGQLDDVRAQGRDRILKILNPEQKKKFNKMMNDLSAKLK
jgi:hypothetical protein